MIVPKKDKTILRELAEEVAKIASFPIQRQKADMWRRLNRLEPVKVMVWINEIPWHEMGPELEMQLRRMLYQWRHMPCDMVIEPKILCPLVVHDTGLGIDADMISAEGDTGYRDPVVVTGASDFESVIKNQEDIEKIQMPQIEVDWEVTERNYELLVDIFKDILPVKKQGAPGFWFAPWDELVTWLGVEEALTYMIERPEFVHQAMKRLMDAHLYRLKQYEKLNALALNNGPYRIGSGGFGFTDELPQEKRWLKKFGLTYYGCCEPLHKKIHILESIPNLRKISISPWADCEEAAANIGNKYVLSLKPNPAILAAENWNPDAARQELEKDLEKTKNCAVEVIMKDISTCRRQPHRLWEWAEMAMKVTERY